MKTVQKLMKHSSETAIQTFQSNGFQKLANSLWWVFDLCSHLDSSVCNSNNNHEAVIASEDLKDGDSASACMCVLRIFRIFCEKSIEHVQRY